MASTPEREPDTGADTGTAAGAQDPRIDTSVPHSARIWNFWLGGKENYPVDRAAGEAYLRVFPGIVDLALAQRLFLRRVVRELSTRGIRQFLDLGTGLPTLDNTHEVAQRITPDARIVYVDNDPLVLAHARALLTSTPQGAAAYLDADACDPDLILERAARTLDFDRPVAVMLLGILGHIHDTAQAREVVDELARHLTSGSYVAVCDGIAASSGRSQAHAHYTATGALPYRLRTPEEIAAFLDGLNVLDPGVVAPNLWRPETEALGPVAVVEARAGVGRVR
ncbi:SAM-dependent methyltransferase [Actinomadura litoris]|uniref:SAM-dependent methyltransferase n=1 Tax=Actinomadura litoris TaxID=2678616 RepID=UPI0028AB7DF0|nr:SAM-dependent methyltransferase [Actinomadura litoris]